jgi:hypothetical protein
MDGHKRRKRNLLLTYKHKGVRYINEYSTDRHTASDTLSNIRQTDTLRRIHNRMFGGQTHGGGIMTDRIRPRGRNNVSLEWPMAEERGWTPLDVEIL